MKSTGQLRHLLVEARRERDEALARLEQNRCGNGHKTLPLKLWTCPACFEIERDEDAILLAEGEGVGE